jgi:hypothetical protein
MVERLVYVGSAVQVHLPAEALRVLPAGEPRDAEAPAQG